MKPAYSLPTMADIAAIPANGYNVVSTFSGCGGMCLGYKMQGFKVLWANEFIEAARQVYALNHPGTIIDGRDIRQVTAEEIKAACGDNEIHVLEGSPPCAQFSTSGKREKKWKQVVEYSETKQRVDDLFNEFARLLSGLRPRVFTAENVQGLVRGTSKGYFKEILQLLIDCGYNVRVKLLDAQWLGVPQHRKRLFFIGVRDDFDVDPVFPAPFPYQYTTREIFPYIDQVKHALRKRPWKIANRPYPTVVQSGHKASITAYFSGGTYIRERMEDGRLQERMIRIDELQKLCSFPDDFVLTGTFEQQWERLGRSVPPLMGSAVAASVLQTLQEIDKH